MDIDLILDAHLDLAEGPIWDASRRRLYFVDIMRGQVHEFDPLTRADRVLDAGEPVGAVSPDASGGLIMAVKSGFARLDVTTGRVTRIATLDGLRPQNRMNDGYTDPRGRFWAGTLAMDHAREQSALYRLDAGGRVTEMLTGVTTSNGIDWSPDGRRMYFVDTGTGRIDVFDFDLDAGTMTNRRPFATIDRADGAPDGMIVDAGGGLWVALWGGGAVRRYAPDGALDLVIRFPAPHTTKCAFGGEDLRDLYVTTASVALTPEQRTQYPHAGGVFHCRPGGVGKPIVPART